MQVPDSRLRVAFKGKKQKQRKKKQDQTTTKDKNDTERICAAESAMELCRLRVFDDCAS